MQEIYAGRYRIPLDEMVSYNIKYGCWSQWGRCVEVVLGDWLGATGRGGQKILSWQFDLHNK